MVGTAFACISFADLRAAVFASAKKLQVEMDLFDQTLIVVIVVSLFAENQHFVLAHLTFFGQLFLNLIL